MLKRGLNVPLVGDFHYIGHKLLADHPACAEALDKYYAKMKTEVDPDPETDRANLEESYRNPKRFEDQRMFPGTDIEALRPRKSDIFGFAISVAVCFAVIALLVWLAGIGG